MPGRVLEFCKGIEDVDHWGARAFATTQQGKKIVEIMVENAKKRESNAKLLEQIEDSIRELLGWRCLGGLDAPAQCEIVGFVVVVVAVVHITLTANMYLFRLRLTS